MEHRASNPLVAGSIPAGGATLAVLTVL